MEKKRGSFSGQLGFIMAAAGSAVGLGNIWRFPYLAAKDGGGIFIIIYLILAVTFGFTLLTAEITIGRKTRQGPLTAYGHVHKRFGFVGILAWLVPVIILPYYCTIGGWVFKYLGTYITAQGESAASGDYFTGFITGFPEPIFWMILYFAVTAIIIISGVEKGIEKVSRILMPILIVMIVVIAVFALTIQHTDTTGAEEVTRTGLEGFGKYLIPDFSGKSFMDIVNIVFDALAQLFFSISVAMGIMIAYGSYTPKETNLMKSINNIEIFDTAVALLAGVMIVPAVFVFQGAEGLESAGPGLIFVTLPKVFSAMGTIGAFIGPAFFIILAFAAITSSVSVMEAIVSGIMDKFKFGRKKASVIVSVYSLVVGLIVCLGYNKMYFEATMPNGSTGQILDIMDYISNYCLMPIVALLTCILIGWVVKPKFIIEEVESNGSKFSRKRLFTIMIRYIAPVLLFFLLLQRAFGLF